MNIVATSLCGVAVLCCFTACDDVRTSFATREAAVSAGALGPGRYLPSFIPPSAHAIADEHNLDTNHGRFQFSHSADDSRWPLAAGFRPAASASNTAAVSTFILDERDGPIDTHYRCDVGSTVTTCTY
jgi:hypothetical protein